MNPEYLFHLINNFIHAHTYLALAIVAGLAVMACLRPKQTFKLMLVILAALAAGYILYYLGQATMTGLSGKEAMINE